jgi:hypothetical protein
MRTRSLLLSVAAVGLLGAGVGRAEVFNEYDPLKSKANDLELVFKGNIVASINLLAMETDPGINPFCWAAQKSGACGGLDQPSDRYVQQLLHDLDVLRSHAAGEYVQHPGPDVQPSRARLKRRRTFRWMESSSRGAKRRGDPEAR